MHRRVAKRDVIKDLGCTLANIKTFNLSLCYFCYKADENDKIFDKSLFRDFGSFINKAFIF